MVAAVCGLLPFIPTYAVAAPASALLAAQGRLPSAVALFLLHFAAYYFGDTLILEDIPGGHPYLLSLGILGGIWTFDNPLQGCLLGPIFLSLLSAFYRLHGEFMGMAAPGEAPGNLAGDGAGDGPAASPMPASPRPPSPPAATPPPGPSALRKSVSDHCFTRTVSQANSAAPPCTSRQSSCHSPSEATLFHHLHAD